MRLATTLLMYCLAAFPCLAQVEINELHPTPVAGEPEWVELYNTSSKSVRLRDWLLCDARTCVRLDDVTLAPRAYAVITRDTSALREVRMVDDDVILIEVHAPSLNNTTDKIMLRDADSVLVDSVAYTMAWGRKGISLERSTDATLQTRWMASLSADSATCGYLNSTVRLQHDLRIKEIRIDARTMRVAVVVQNFGLQAMPSVACVCTSNGRTLVRQQCGSLQPNEEFVIPLSAADLRTDSLDDSVVVRVRVEIEDDRDANNSMMRTIVLPPPSGSIVINEVMFDPQPTQCDYVEIFNGSGRPVYLEGWMICDEGTEGGRDTLIVSENVVVPNDSYGVIAVDTVVHSMMSDDAWSRTFPHQRRVSFNLNAGGDDVVLLNPSGFVVDSVHVSSAWHSPILASGKGVSLERLAPLLTSGSAGSWTSSAAQRGGTPGTVNSVSICIDTTASITASPSPFSTNPTNALYPCVLSWKVPYQQCAMFVRVLRRDGVLVRDLLNNVFGGAIGAVAWDGRDESGNTTLPGPYIVSVLAIDAQSPASRRALGIVVVGE